MSICLRFCISQIFQKADGNSGDQHALQLRLSRLKIYANIINSGHKMQEIGIQDMNQDAIPSTTQRHGLALNLCPATGATF